MKENLFDDIIEDEYGMWTQLCRSHAIEFKANMEHSGALGICGVKGCNEESDYYLTID